MYYPQPSFTLETGLTKLPRLALNFQFPCLSLPSSWDLQACTLRHSSHSPERVMSAEAQGCMETGRDVGREGKRNALMLAPSSHSPRLVGLARRQQALVCISAHRPFPQLSLWEHGLSGNLAQTGTFVSEWPAANFPDEVNKPQLMVFRHRALLDTEAP